MTKQNKQTVVVTGGSRGIGRAICLALAGPDTQIYFNYFSPTDPDAEKAAALHGKVQGVSRVHDLSGKKIDIGLNRISQIELLGACLSGG